MNRKTDMHEALQLCIDAMLHDGVPTDPYHPRRVALNAAEAALASRPDAQADERGEFEDVRPLVNEWIASRGTSMDGAAYGAAIELAAFVAARAAAPQAEAAQGVPGWMPMPAAPDAAPSPDRGTCQRCGGTGLVDDGEITGSGGVEFENGPVKYVKDCPECCAMDREQVGEAQKQANDDDWLDDMRRAIRVYAHACCYEKSGVPAASAEIERLLAACAPSPSRECAEQNPPFSNCSFRICDLPGQCRAEGKCHHPKGEQPRECGERQSFPERDATKTNAEQGLYRKFEVRRVDGSDALGGKHHGCEYFVLDMTHDQHAPAALRAYAQSCASTHPHLSADLMVRFGGERQGAAAVVREALEAAFEEREGWRVKVAAAVRTIGAASASIKAEAKCKACNGNDGDMPCAYPEGRADCLRNASASTLGETVQGKPMATTAEFDVAIETLRHVIECLRNTGRYTDEEGEATDFLEPLLYAHLSAPQPQAAEPPTHWRDKPQNIALLAVERGDPVYCDGTFACPICGKGEPHQHSSDEIAKFRITQRQVAEPKGLTEHLYILSANEEAMESAIEAFEGSSEGEGLKSVLYAQKQLCALLSKGE